LTVTEEITLEQYQSLAFIGGGNMARSLIGGLLNNGWPAEKIMVSDPDPDQPARLFQLSDALTVVSNNTQVLTTADVVVLAVKPQILQTVCRELAAQLQQRPCLIISIAAGVRTEDINRWCGGGLAIIRCMPNTPALVQSGATGLYANTTATESDKALAETLLRAVGITVWLDDEVQLNAVTALSGSGPAYHFLVMEAMQNAAQAMGLNAKVAKLLSIETAFGAAKLALESSEDLDLLRERVTSKGGTTEQALATLEAGDIRALFNNALQAASDKAEALAEELGRDQ
jgi:pyrroline-5-carboxylate reductase